MRLNLANIFSLLRIVLSPLFFFLLIFGNNTGIAIAAILFFIAALTDYFDGWVARKYHEVTKTGKFIDPLADKFLTSFAFVAFAIMNILPWWMVIIIILRDLLTTLMRIFQGSGKFSIKTSYAAKTKTFIQMFFIAFLMIMLLMKSILHDQDLVRLIDDIIYSDYIYYTMLFITLLTIWTAIEYLYQNKSLKKA